MRSKGIAIRTILLLVIGILVVGILLYLAYKQLMSPSLGRLECRTALVSWCTSCKLVEDEGWTLDWANDGVGYMPEKKVTDCAKDYFGVIIDSDLRCKDMKDDCKNFIPIE